MANWRETKRKALGKIHETFEIPAVLLTHAAGTPVRVNVRLHTKQIVSEQQVDDWSNAGKLLDLTNQVIFRQSEIPAIHGATVPAKSYVIVAADEIYRIGPARPAREGFIWCEVTDLSVTECAALLSSLPDTDDPAWQGILP